MSGKCSICESEYRAWIEEQHDAGKSTREIAEELKKKFGFSVSHTAIANHLKYHRGEDRIEKLAKWIDYILRRLDSEQQYDLEQQQPPTLNNYGYRVFRHDLGLPPEMDFNPELIKLDKEVSERIAAEKRAEWERSLEEQRKREEEYKKEWESLSPEERRRRLSQKRRAAEWFFNPPTL